MFIATFLAWREQHNIANGAANRPQELIASFTMDNSLNIANDLNQIEVIIYNNGIKSSIIYSISLIINYFNDDKNDVLMRNDICDDPVIAQFASFFQLGNVVPHVTTNINKEQNVSLYYYKADRYVVDGSSIAPPIVIDAGKSRGLSAYFKVDRSKNNGSNAVVWCPVIKLFDNNGHAFFTVCRGSIIASTKNGGYGSGPYALPPVILLPPPPNNTMIYYVCRPE